MTGRMKGIQELLDNRVDCRRFLWHSFPRDALYRRGGDFSSPYPFKWTYPHVLSFPFFLPLPCFCALQRMPTEVGLSESRVLNRRAIWELMFSTMSKNLLKPFMYISELS